MTQFDPDPPTEAVKEVQQRWQETTDTFGRVYETALGITNPTPYTEISEVANCSPNAAKKHLERLTEMGIVRADRDSRPARYERNDGYLEWQEASRIAKQLSLEAIIERVRRLEARQKDFETAFETTDPSDISVFDHDNHETIHERMEAVSEWKSIGRDIRLYELARRLAQNDGHFLPA